MTLTLLLLLALALAAATRANDNIKGAATLIGCDLTDYRRASVLTTATTALGGLFSLLFAHGLL